MKINKTSHKKYKQNLPDDINQEDIDNMVNLVVIMGKVNDNKIKNIISEIILDICSKGEAKLDLKSIISELKKIYYEDLNIVIKNLEEFTSSNPMYKF